ncbi:MAG TPA: CPBP family intramembrane metalloprotease [Clostridiaceae bacterium]|nr:CPBP family intramembrane metalloprotease [Clostridiaceae bacterium]
MLYLSITANSYIAGLVGVVQNKISLPSGWKRLNRRNAFQVFYVILAVLIVGISLFMIYSTAEYDLAEIFQRITGPLIVSGLHPLWFMFIAFGIQITFDATYMVVYSRRQKQKTYYKAPEQSIALTLAVGVFEEMSYRVIILLSLIKLGLSPYLALGVSSLLYLLNHGHMINNAENLKVYWTLSRLLLGLLLGAVMLRGGVIYAIVMHLLYNLYVMLAVPYFSRKYTNA